MNKVYTRNQSRSYPTKIDGSKYVTIFCDASHDHSSGASGFGFWIKHGSPASTVKVGGSFHCSGSSKAEEIAILESLKYAISNIDLAGKCIVISSDCVPAMQATDLSILPECIESFKFKHVPGHKGVTSPCSAVNTWCDREAKRQMRSLRDGVSLGEEDGN